MTREELEKEKQELEDALMKYIESMCYEVLNLKGFYEDYKNIVINCGHDLETGSTFWINGGIEQKAAQMNKYYNQYAQGYREISILCHKLGGKYLKLFETMFEVEQD